MEFAKIKVTRDSAKILKYSKVPSGLIGGTITVEYDRFWMELQKKVVFKGADEKTIFTNESIIEIPKEVVAKAGPRLQIGFIGTDTSRNLLLPSFYVDLGQIRQGADSSGDSTTDYTLPGWAQLEGRMDDLEDKVENGGNVAYNEEQKLTEKQKEQARVNIGAQPVGEYLTEVPEGYAKNEAIEKVDRKVDTLREVVSKSNIVESASGDLITVSDASDMELAGLRIFGKTSQNGTPTPEAPVALDSVGDDGSVDVTVCGKNVLQITAESKTTLGVTFTVREDNTILVNGTCTGSSNLYYPISTFNLPAGSYEFSGAPTGAIVGDFDTYIQATGNVTGTNYGTVARGADNITDKEKKFTLTEECAVKCHIRIKPGIVVDNKVFKLMIRHASFNNGDYEPYKAQTLTVPTPNGLPGIPVTSGGNYTDDSGQQWVCDEVDFEKGQYIQRIYSYTFTGQETINSFDSGKTLGKDIKLLGLPSCIVPNKASGSNVSPMLCTHEAVTTQNALKNDSGGIAVAVWGDTQYLYFSGTSYGSVDGLKTAMAEAYASGTPYVWMYALETPIIRELTEAEKVDYTALHTNYPNTTVFNDGGAGMEVKYVADTKLYIDNKFAELANAMLNN